MISQEAYNNLEHGDLVHYDGDDMAVVSNGDHFRKNVSRLAIVRVAIKAKRFCRNCIVNATCNKRRHMLWCCQNELIRQYPEEKEKIIDWVNRLYR